jgi:polyribonucleotide nucleotidyltransferase
MCAQARKRLMEEAEVGRFSTGRVEKIKKLLDFVEIWYNTHAPIFSPFFCEIFLRI